MSKPWIIVGGITLALLVGSFWYAGMVSEKNNEGITFNPHIKGDDTAVVVLEEYSDFQCPACAAFQPYITDLLAEYGDSIRFEYKHFPLPIHRHAEAAARAAEAAAQQGQFFLYHDQLFAKQSEWSQATNPTSFFLRYAEEAGLDVETFKRHFNASMIRDKVREDAAFARSLGLTGTPSFFLNGERMVFRTYEEFRTQVVGLITGSSTAPVTADTASVEFGL